MIDMNHIYKEYARVVYKYLLSLCNDGNLAEELTQETFYRAVKSSKRFDGTCKASTWLCQIAKHVWYQELDKKRRKQTVPLEENWEMCVLSPEEDYCRGEEKMQLMKSVHGLEETSKEVVLLRITGAFSFKEIGEIFNRNENWARVTFYRAKQKIVKGK